MAESGSISTLGVGSGLQLQDILDQLREVDTSTLLNPKKDRITALETQFDEFTVVNNKLLTMKSSALDMSLSSTFLGRTVTSSDEDVLTATVSDGATVQSASLTVTSLASKSSWMSGGKATEDAIVYVPTSQQSTNGVAAKTSTIASGAGSLTITFGASDTITVSVDAATVLEDGGANSLVDLINNDAENGGKVTASSFQVDSSWYLRIEATGGTGENYRVGISTNGTDLTMAPPNKTFAYQVGDTTTTISVAADTTLTELAALINSDADNPGATASIIDDGGANPYRLVLQADDTGEDNRIRFLAQMPDMTMTEQQGAAASSLNAQFSIDGISYQRQDNTITDVFSGLSFTLKGTGTSTISVSNNDTAIEDLITSLVSAYNDAVQELRDKIAYDDEEDQLGILAGTTLRDLPFELQNLMTTANEADGDGNIQSLFDLGLEFERDGTISMDSETLSSAIANYADGVKAFFLGDEEQGITGFADMVNERLRTLTTSGGQIDAEKTSAQDRIDVLELSIVTETERLDKKYALLTKQFIELDRYMNQMTSISNFLTSQFNSLTKTSGSGK